MTVFKYIDCIKEWNRKWIRLWLLFVLSSFNVIVPMEFKLSSCRCYWNGGQTFLEWILHIVIQCEILQGREGSWTLMMVRPEKMLFCWTIPPVEFCVGLAPGRALGTVSGDPIIEVGILPCHILKLAALSGWWDLLEISSVSCRLICWFFLSARHLMLCF